MPIYKNNQKISVVYKGTKDVDAIYKGSNLVYVAPFSWQSLSVNYLYYQLIPSIVNNKQVKNAARLLELQGNSVVENQLISNGNFSSAIGWITLRCSLSVDDNIATLTCTENGTMAIYRSDYALQTGKKYLVKCQAKAASGKTLHISGVGSSPTLTANGNWQDFYYIDNSNTDAAGYPRFCLQNASVGDTAQYRIVNIIDLTQMFPFDAPTTLTDVRVQSLLNRGYIPPNTGTLKSVDISEFSSEPYNLFDEIFEGGGIGSYTGINNNNTDNFRTKNYIQVVPNFTYIFEYNRPAQCFIYVLEYDENKNYLGVLINGYNTSSTTSQVGSQTKYVKIHFYKNESGWRDNPPSQNDIQLCVHNSSVNLGYKPHQTFTPITLKYQGSGVNTSHDTMEIGNENVVFTKDRATYTFTGSETWTLEGNYAKYYTSMSIPDSLNAKGVSSSEVGNIISTVYQPYPQSELSLGREDKAICVGTSSSTKVICVRDTTNITSAATAQSYMTGKTIEYQLANPQVISIPRKHLGIVRIRDLSWTTDTFVGITLFRTDSLVNVIALHSSDFNTANWVYCSPFSCIGGKALTSNDDLTLSTRPWGTSGNILIVDKSVNTTTDFVNKYGDYYIFYETQDEVADFTNKAKIEVGGTISAFEDDNGTDCSVLPNVEFEIKCSK